MHLNSVAPVLDLRSAGYSIIAITFMTTPTQSSNTRYGTIYE